MIFLTVVRKDYAGIEPKAGRATAIFVSASLVTTWRGLSAVLSACPTKRSRGNAQRPIPGVLVLSRQLESFER